MEVGKRSTSRSGVVAAGSVWESRMKIDEFKGGIKVFNGEETSNNSEQVDAAVDAGKELKVYRRLNKNSQVGNGKRKTWKSESSENPIKLIKGKSENLRSSIQIRKTRSKSVDGIEKNLVQIRKTKSESVDFRGKKIRVDANKDLSVSVDGIERDPIQIRKGKAQLDKEIGDSIDGVEKLSSSSSPVIELKKAKSEPKKVLDESAKKIDAETEESENPIRKTRSNDVSKEFGICQENVGQGKSAPELVADEEVDEEDDDDFDEEDEDFEEEHEEAKKENCEEIDVEVEVEKEINMEEQETMQVLNEEKKIEQFEVDEKTITISTKSHQFNEKPIPISPKLDQIQEKPQQPIPISSKLTQIYQNHLSNASKLHQVNEKPIPIPNSSKLNQALAKPIAILNSPKKLNQIQDKPIPPSPLLRKKQPSPTPVTPREPSVVFPCQTKTTPSEFPRRSETANKFQSLVDLVMWRDVSKSALVFGMGTFFMISSSYTKDLNVSFISVTSYIGLFYLAAIFLYKSILRRGVVDMDDSDLDCMVGEEEAIWLLKLVFPYVNEFVMKLKGLFSGDPATTMKLAVLLFVMARYGSSITIWKMVKLGKFWIHRFRDAWESCSHKKAVAFTIFTFVWNLSSVVARVWAVFMLFVAVRYYQQSMMKDEDWVEEEEEESEDLSSQRQERRQRQGQGPTIVEIVKEKKGS
ncbi:Reticulon [Dillenia turbinata]|uniref:Reticulon-like protein n=1 Tax=Dillenia turbinata TaxID=194707 RepID=A0AAN8ZPU6_9MAGN